MTYKIDWTTIESYSNPSDIFSSYDSSLAGVQLFKFGRLCILQGLSFNNHTLAASTAVNMAMLKPAFRPVGRNVRMTVVDSAMRTINGVALMTGTLQEYGPTTAYTGPTYYASAIWVTA